MRNRLVQWLALHRQPPLAQRQSILGSLAERIDQLSERLAEPLPPAAAATSTDWLAEQSLAEIRRTIRAGKWDEAAALLDGFSPADLDDPRLSSLRQEIQSAREAARSQYLAQLNAARQVSDPDRVLELHQTLIPLLDAETRVVLEADLSQWFLRLIHNRLRIGKIQTDLVVLAGRIADAFSHTVGGASLRASLPTLRRSAGLCSRCGQPYNGIASACPACLAQAQHSTKAASATHHLIPGKARPTPRRSGLPDPERAELSVNGRGRFTMGLRRLESVPQQPGFLIDLRP